MVYMNSLGSLLFAAKGVPSASRILTAGHNVGMNFGSPAPYSSHHPHVKDVERGWERLTTTFLGSSGPWTAQVGCLSRALSEPCHPRASRAVWISFNSVSGILVWSLAQ